jgi:cephalosporin-C deacetylase-like acetyl esterase
LITFFIAVLIIFVSSCSEIDKTEKVYYPEDFVTYEGVEIFRPSQWNRNRFLRLLPGIDGGNVHWHYFGQSAMYKVSLSGTSLGPGAMTVRLIVNSRDVGFFEFPAEPGKDDLVESRLARELTGINIPRYSEVTLHLTSTDSRGWGIDRLTLIPEGRYQGERVSLPRPSTLRVYNTIEEQHAGHSMVQRFVQQNVDRQLAIRDSVLSSFDTPEQWRAYQKQIRDNLSSYFGSFPERTPLNPRVVGRIDYPDYYIEKTIYESQPDYFVPANVYIPKNRKFPVPGVIYTIGHWDLGKMAPDIHKICIGLAKKGYFVIAVDPMGQGERSEYFNPLTLEPAVGLGVAQHHYFGRPAFLVDWSLPGLRTWDYIRALDYLVSRPEVDTSMLAIAGNSGGGQMAILTAAVDKRIKVVAAAHPGGSCEETFLNGRFISERDLYSLVPPVPCRIIVGEASGEAPYRGRKLEDMARFYEGLGMNEDYRGMDLVDALHDNTQPVRESTYEWLNRWFDKSEEGKEEPAVEDEEVETLWCTESGVVLASLGGESGQTLNQKRIKQIYQRIDDLDELKERVTNRIGLGVPDRSELPRVELKESFTANEVSVEKFAYTSEPGIEVAALLLRPLNQREKQNVILYVSEKGKPGSLELPSIPVSLVRAGYPVLSIDVRGTGETASHPPIGDLDQYTGYTAEQWIRDVAANDAASFGRTMLGMQVLDVLKGIDLISGRRDLRDKPVIIIGEGLGGLWALIGSIYSPDIQSVITVNTLPSYKLLVSSRYYNQHGYFYIPGVLRDFDIPDLGRLVSPREQLWIDPVDALSSRMEPPEAIHILGDVAGLRVVSTPNGLSDEISREILDMLK